MSIDPSWLKAIGAAKRVGVVRALTVVAALTWCGTVNSAEGAWKPQKPIEIILPGGGGGGQDRTARVIQKLLQDGGLVSTPVTIVNRPGGGGNLAYTYLNQFQGDAHYLGVATPTLLTNHILRISPLSYTHFTPLSVLYGEHIAFAVRADGPIKNGRDLAERLRKNPEAVSFAFGTSRGNANHIAAGMMAKAAGADVTRLKVVIFKSSMEATTSMMGGHVDVVATPASTYVPVMGTGKVRVIAIAGPVRVGGHFADVPTWKEQGLDVVMPSYRMFMAAQGLTPQQLRYWDEAFGRLSRMKEWADELKANEWQNTYMNAAASRKYLDRQYDLYRNILEQLGLAK